MKGDIDECESGDESKREGGGGRGEGGGPGWRAGDGEVGGCVRGKDKKTCAQPRGADSGGEGGCK
jgi:hypothetical protein